MKYTGLGVSSGNSGMGANQNGSSARGEIEDKPQVVVVDDEPVNLKTVSDVLKESFSLAMLKGGLEAIEYIRNHGNIDLILLDINMPGMDGFETMSLLRDNKLASDVPVIFFTSTHDMDSVVKGMNLGGAGYIVKPIEPVELLKRVGQYITLKLLKEARDYLSTTDSFQRKAIRKIDTINIMIKKEGQHRKQEKSQI